ncbi:sensor histidine kinase [Arthrobacter halodurans]|uniref:histidine kinase n=1 Tax=Arthrobacter halodurans TaxID=516699 RepID=A0ABV4US24_9MICC
MRTTRPGRRPGSAGAQVPPEPRRRPRRAAPAAAPDPRADVAAERFPGGPTGGPGQGAAGGPESRPADGRRAVSLSRRMLTALVSLLALICLLIGTATHTAMRSSLYAQLDEQLAFASERAAAFGGQPSRGQDPLNAPGQASGTLNARLIGNVILNSGVLDHETGERRGLEQADFEAIASVVPGAGPVDADLSVGPYRLVAVQVQDASQGTLITGLPLNAMHQTLTSLSWTMLLVSAAGLAATGLIGSVIIRRALRPLERVAGVAGSVAALPLDAGEVRLAQRVPPEDSVPGTEAGDVGHALNALLDNVESALAVRQGSEEKMRRFVADASHELRTPLSSIRGYSELVSATEHLSDDGRQSLDRVIEQSLRMGALVDNLLLLARLDEGKRAEFADVDLTLLVAEAARDVRVAAPDHEWRLRLPSVPVPVRGDADQLSRALANLLSNARKHTPEGTVVEASLDVSPDGRRALLAVADDGEGIDPGFLPAVFERFTRADRARSGTDGTTGLGLPIVKAIVESHGGEISVTSRPGRTVFSISLPLAIPAPPRPAQPPRSAPDPARDPAAAPARRPGA